jgi:hypothetical protein
MRLRLCGQCRGKKALKNYATVVQEPRSVLKKLHNIPLIKSKMFIIYLFIFKVLHTVFLRTEYSGTSFIKFPVLNQGTISSALSKIALIKSRSLFKSCEV